MGSMRAGPGVGSLQDIIATGRRYKYPAEQFAGHKVVACTCLATLSFAFHVTWTPAGHIRGWVFCSYLVSTTGCLLSSFLDAL